MPTTFHSTRSTTDSLTAKQAIRKGIADDGGLFVSDALGKTKVDVASLPGKSYQQIAAEVLGALLPDFTAEELGQCIADAYGEQWSDERITPLKPLGDDYVLELFNGPTSAFKDVALQILPRFKAHPPPADGDAAEKIMILPATSGDPGTAALADNVSDALEKAATMTNDELYAKAQEEMAAGALFNFYSTTFFAEKAAANFMRAYPALDGKVVYAEIDDGESYTILTNTIGSGVKDSADMALTLNGA